MVVVLVRGFVVVLGVLVAVDNDVVVVVGVSGIDNAEPDVTVKYNRKGPWWCWSIGQHAHLLL